MTTPTTTILSEEVLADIRSAAWLEQELQGDLDRHRRHQMADICEPDNVERVWRVLALSVAEVRLALSAILATEEETPETNGLLRQEEWRFAFLFQVAASTRGYLREKIHGYLVAQVMADRTAVIIPSAESIWRQRAVAALADLRVLAATVRPPLAPVRRPIWPM